MGGRIVTAEVLGGNRAPAIGMPFAFQPGHPHGPHPMKIFLLWRAPADAAPELAPAAVAAKLLAHFGPLAKTELTPLVRSVGPVHLVWLELPIAGFRAPLFEEDGPAWALAPDYPLNARRLLRAAGITPRDDAALLQLAAELEARPAPIVRELVPPSCLLWRSGNEVRVQNDGLGQAQLFELEKGGLWALTNRVMALRALGTELVPVPEEWAARFVTNWFPLDRSGYEDVRFLAGGTQLRIGRDGVRRTRHDPVGEWVKPAPRTRADALELGRHGLLNVLADAVELAEKPSVGLSGGWDSRCVASCLRMLGADFELRVRGQESHFDVILSTELARIAGLPHRIKSEGGIPPDHVDGLRLGIQNALRWQGGYFATKKHKNFLAKKGKDGLDGGVVNVMGQHAGVGKADFMKKIESWKHDPATFEERLLDALMADAPSFLRADRLETVRELLRASYRAAHAHGLEGHGPLLYYYLNEFTRRWGSATVAGQSGIVVAPFLCPDVIRACHALPPEELPSKPLHRHVTALHAPDWAVVPYADQVTEGDFASGRLPRVEAQKETEDELTPRWRAVRHHRKYHYKYFWKDVGQPLLEEAFEQGGFWTEVFDADQAQRNWMNSGSGSDCLSIAHLLPGVLADSRSPATLPA